MFSNFVQKLYRKVDKSRFTVFKNYFVDAQFFTFFVFGPYQILSKNFSDISHNFFCNVVRTVFPMFRRTVWWKVLFSKSSSSFYLQTLRERFSELVWNFHRKVVKNLSCVFRNHFEDTDFSGKFLIPMYTRTMSENVS